MIMVITSIVFSRTYFYELGICRVMHIAPLFPEWIYVSGKNVVEARPYFTLLYFALLCFALFCFALLCFALLCFALLCLALPYLTLLYFTLLYFTLLYFTLLYFTLPYLILSLFLDQCRDPDQTCTLSYSVNDIQRRKRSLNFVENETQSDELRDLYNKIDELQGQVAAQKEFLESISEKV